MTELEKYKGYSLVFSRIRENFEAQDEDGKSITTSSSFSGLKANVDAFIKRKKKLKPFDVIRKRDNSIVRVSAVASEDFDEIWISYKEPGAKRRSRIKEYLFDRWRHRDKPDYYFFNLNPQNMEILAKINTAEKSVEVIKAYISRMEKTYSDPLTTEMLEALINPNKKGMKLALLSRLFERWYDVSYDCSR